MLRKGTSTNSTCMEWLREIFWITKIFNIHIVAKYVNTKSNLVADTLSRLLYIRSENEARKCLEGSGLCCIESILIFAEKDLSKRAEILRKASVSKSTLKTRERQWLCYLKVCSKFKWIPYGCNSAQACKYVAFLSNSMRYSSVIDNYQTVIFYHNVKGSLAANWSDPKLSQTVKGIKNLETIPEDVKDPLTEKHLVSLLPTDKIIHLN